MPHRHALDVGDGVQRTGRQFAGMDIELANAGHVFSFFNVIQSRFNP